MLFRSLVSAKPVVIQPSVPTSNNNVLASPAGTGNGANAPQNGNVQADVSAPLSDGGRKRIEDLLHDIQVLQKQKDDIGDDAGLLGRWEREGLQEQIDKKFSEIDDILHGR